MNVNSKKHLRTEAQLVRKRHSDKVNHKAKRDRTKSQMDKLEAEMVQLRQRVKEISEQLHVLHADVLKNQNSFSSSSSSSSSSYHTSPQLPQSPSSQPTIVKDRSPESMSIPLSPNACSGHIHPAIPNGPGEVEREAAAGGGGGGASSDFNNNNYHYFGTTFACPFSQISPPSSSFTNATTTTAIAGVPPFPPSTIQQVPTPPPSFIPSCPTATAVDGSSRIGNLLDVLSDHPRRVLVDCRCGVDHKHATECLEYSTFLILLRTHENLSRSIHTTPPRLPRNPSLLGLFRHSCSNNPIIHILGAVFNRIHPVNIFTLFAIYLLMYRFLRWRLYPDQESYDDVPPWLLPSEIQKSIPHAVSIDFLPWPSLRDFLTTHQHRDSRHSVNLYIHCIRFKWPESKPFYSTTAGGEILLNPDFEAQLCNYDNWMLSAEWAKMFPRLVRYVNVDDGSIMREDGNNQHDDYCARRDSSTRTRCDGQ